MTMLRCIPLLLFSSALPSLLLASSSMGLFFAYYPPRHGPVADLGDGAYNWNCCRAVESLKLKVNKALMFFCEAYFRPFPPQSDIRAFLWVNGMKPRKMVFGVGVNDADYAVQRKETIGYVGGKRKQKQVWVCPYYRVWKEMLRRCYSAKFQERNPTYISCTVSDNWLTFTNFKAWMEKQQWEGKQIDKDLLFEGNKVYSADSCVFVTPMANSFTIDRRAARGEWLIGVYWHKTTGEFRARCNNPFTNKQESLGRFICEKQAHEAWLKRKLELAHELAAIQTDPRVAKALVDRYSKPQII